MTTTTVTRVIDAPISNVFDAVAHIENFQKAVPQITRVEMLTDVTRGVGTRFRETRLMKGKENTTELEVTEYEPDQRVRLVTDTHGTVWDTVFTMADKGGKTELVMVMEARAHKLLPKIINPLIKGMIAREIEKDLDAVKAYCEA